MARKRRKTSQKEHPQPRCLAVPVAEATEAQLAAAAAMRAGHAREYDFYRKIMEWLEAPKVCPRRACRRAGKCTGEWVPCFEAAMPFLQENVLPGLRAAILARRGNPDA